MIVDYLHSYYTMPARLWVGGVERIVTLRWFRAPAGAKKLPFPTCFFTHVDDKVWERNPGEPGELNQSRIHDQGRNNGYQGQCYLGDPQWFLTGQLPASVLNPPPPSTCLCQIQPARAAGALVLTGAATVPNLDCQGSHGTGTKSIDFGDGTGPHALIDLGGVPHKWANVAGGGGIRFGLYWPGGTCHNYGNRILGAVFGGSPSYPVLETWTLNWCMATAPTVGGWTAPASSPYDPGAQYVLYS